MVPAAAVGEWQDTGPLEVGAEEQEQVVVMVVVVGIIITIINIMVWG